MKWELKQETECKEEYHPSRPIPRSHTHYETIVSKEQKFSVLDTVSFSPPKKYHSQNVEPFTEGVIISFYEIQPSKKKYCILQPLFSAKQLECLKPGELALKQTRVYLHLDSTSFHHIGVTTKEIFDSFKLRPGKQVEFSLSEKSVSISNYFCSSKIIGTKIEDIDEDALRFRTPLKPLSSPQKPITSHVSLPSPTKRKKAPLSCDSEEIAAPPALSEPSIYTAPRTKPVTVTSAIATTPPKPTASALSPSPYVTLPSPTIHCIPAPSAQALRSPHSAKTTVSTADSDTESSPLRNPPSSLKTYVSIPSSSQSQKKHIRANKQTASEADECGGSAEEEEEPEVRIVRRSSAAPLRKQIADSPTRSDDEFRVDSETETEDEDEGDGRRKKRRRTEAVKVLAKKARVTAEEVWDCSKRVPEVSLAPENIREGEKQLFVNARVQLQTASRPTRIPCREKELSELKRFLRSALTNPTGVGTSMYISGVPGTGKTSCVLQVMAELKQELKTDFTFAHINGLRLTDPTQAYTQLHLALAGEKATPAHACDLLSHRFCYEQSVHSTRGRPTARRKAAASAAKRLKGGSKGSKPVVVLLDELDKIVSMRQSVIYNFFDWPNRAGSHLIVVGIANTMDLPERLLPRVESRISMRRLVFQPYTKTQILAILRSRLADMPELFSDDALEMIARKVSAFGDARSALEMARRAVENAALHNADTVSIDHTLAASEDLAAQPLFLTLKALSLHEVLMVCSVLAVARRTGLPQACFATVREQHLKLCRQYKLLCPNEAQMMAIAARLTSLGLLLLEGGGHGQHQQVCVNVAPPDLERAFPQDSAARRANPYSTPALGPQPRAVTPAGVVADICRVLSN